MRVRDLDKALERLVSGDDDLPIVDRIEARLHELAHVYTCAPYRRNPELAYSPMEARDVDRIISNAGQDTDMGEIRANAIAIEAARILLARAPKVRAEVEAIARSNLGGNVRRPDAPALLTKTANTKRTKNLGRMLARFVQRAWKEDRTSG